MSTVTALTTTCVVNIVHNSTLLVEIEGQLSLPPVVGDTLCPEDCSNQGQCVKGKYCYYEICCTYFHVICVSQVSTAENYFY